jgi:prevent-host-death family protein
MTNITSEEARTKFSEIVNRAAYGHERTIITKHGKSVAAVVSMDDLHLLERVLAKLEDETDTQAAIAALDEAEKNGTRSLQDVKADLGL